MFTCSNNKCSRAATTKSHVQQQQKLTPSNNRNSCPATTETHVQQQQNLTFLLTFSRFGCTVQGSILRTEFIFTHAFLKTQKCRNIFTSKEAHKIPHAAWGHVFYFCMVEWSYYLVETPRSASGTQFSGQVHRLQQCLDMLPSQSVTFSARLGFPHALWHDGEMFAGGTYGVYRIYSPAMRPEASRLLKPFSHWYCRHQTLTLTAEF